MMKVAISVAQKAELFLVVGTSLVVYPAASLVQFVPSGVPITVVDPVRPAIFETPGVNFIEKGASQGLRQFVSNL